MFLAGLLSAAAPATGDSGAPKKPLHIGVISFAEPGLRTHLDQSLIQALREKDYVEGVNLIIEWRYADGYRDRVPQVPKGLAGIKLDAIVTTCTPTTRATAAAAPKAPIAMAGVSDPVGQGFIASYQRLGGEQFLRKNQTEDSVCADRQRSRVADIHRAYGVSPCAEPMPHRAGLEHRHKGSIPILRIYGKSERYPSGYWKDRFMDRLLGDIPPCYD